MADWYLVSITVISTVVGLCVGYILGLNAKVIRTWVVDEDKIEDLIVQAKKITPKRTSERTIRKIVELVLEYLVEVK